MTQKILSTLLLLAFTYPASAQLVIDKKAIVKSGENFAINLVKGQHYKKLRDFSEDIHSNYAAIESLQQRILDDLRQAESIRDLHWADLSKSLYLATELIQGAVRPGLEIDPVWRDPVWTDYVIEHPLFQRSPDDTYRNLFVAGVADPLPNDLTSFRQARQTSQSSITSFHQLAAERKAYAAVAFQYLAEDLLLKAIEMNEVIKQPERFAMTEAERIRLQSFSEDYLLLSGQLLERSDALLLDVARVKPLQRQAGQQQRSLERTTIASTPVLDY